MTRVASKQRLRNETAWLVARRLRMRKIFLILLTVIQSLFEMVFANTFTPSRDFL